MSRRSCIPSKLIGATAPYAPSSAPGRVGALATLAQMHELPALIVRFRTLAKLKSTYTDALVKLINPDIRVITHGRQRIIQEFTLKVKKGRKYTIEKLNKFLKEHQEKLKQAKKQIPKFLDY